MSVRTLVIKLRKLCIHRVVPPPDSTQVTQVFTALIFTTTMEELPKLHVIPRNLVAIIMRILSIWIFTHLLRKLSLVPEVIWTSVSAIHTDLYLMIMVVYIDRHVQLTMISLH
jgi:hypothetical protein